MKSNPLFHDSTVGQDANVQTQFELNKLEVLTGDRVFLGLDLGDSFLVHEMNFNVFNNLFETSVWLKHRKEISYNYFIKRGETIIASSPLKRAYAMHSLTDTWEPVGEIELQKFIENFKTPKQVVDLDNQIKSSHNDEDFYDDLIKKWDL